MDDELALQDSGIIRLDFSAEGFISVCSSISYACYLLLLTWTSGDGANGAFLVRCGAARAGAVAHHDRSHERGDHDMTHSSAVRSCVRRSRGSRPSSLLCHMWCPDRMNSFVLWSIYKR